MTSAKRTLVVGTVRKAVDYVASTFMDCGREDPRLDREGRTCRILLQQYERYKKKDPKKTTTKSSANLTNSRSDTK